MFLDLVKAFIIVNYSIMLSELEKMRISVVESLSGAISDSEIPRDVFVCVLTGSLCNM